MRLSFAPKYSTVNRVQSIPHFSGGKPKLLIIDDNRDYAEGISSMASGLFNVQLAHSLNEGKSQIKKFKPDVILTDWNLGDGTGDDIASFATSLSEPYSKNKVVIMTTEPNKVKSSGHKVFYKGTLDGRTVVLHLKNNLD